MLKGALILSPSQQPENVCKVCGSEELHCRDLSRRIMNYIRNGGYNNLFIAETLIYSSQKLNQAVKFSNEQYDRLVQSGIPHRNILHLCLHTDANAGTGGGVLTMHHPANKDMPFLAKSITSELTALLGKGRTPQTNGELYEINNAKANVLYLETMFHDNLKEAKFYHANMDRIASTITTELIQFLTQ